MIKRRHVIMRLMPVEIPLLKIIEKLELDNSEIKKIYDYKMKAIHNDEKYLKLTRSILMDELNDLSEAVRLFAVRNILVIYVRTEGICGKMERDVSIVKCNSHFLYRNPTLSCFLVAIAIIKIA